MSTIKKISLAVIIIAIAIPALAGMAVQFNDPLPGVFYSQSMGATKVGAIIGALAMAAFGPHDKEEE